SCVPHCRNSYPELCSAICSCQKSRFGFPLRGKLRHVLSRCRSPRRYGSSPRVGSLAVSASLTEESGTGLLREICLRFRSIVFAQWATAKSWGGLPTGTPTEEKKES